jgi:dihydroorotate dehydrogenase (NAD+) catalytic subunit
MGGITSGRDVLEYILVGAAAVQIGTVNFSEPAAAVRILAELESEMARLGLERLADLRGRLAV